MIKQIASSGVHAADIAALRQGRAKKTERGDETSVQAGKTQKPAHPAHPHGHIPPGLARAAEKIASKIFSRADTDANGMVTQEELSTIHSRHARTLASSDLFKKTTTEIPTDPASETLTPTTPDTVTNTTSPESDAATDTPTETTTETPAQIGVTEAQLKEALTKFFYAKVGVTYAPPAPPTTEQPDPVTPANTTPGSDPISEEPSKQTFTAVA